ncbi:MAG TPA: ABC transporter substrate-binding protein [Nitrososphaerales archaeon]|nr:ABC transporter substrate-binding protein [Nitrososphaerales archaeon]
MRTVTIIAIVVIVIIIVAAGAAYALVFRGTNTSTQTSSSTNVQSSSSSFATTISSSNSTQSVNFGIDVAQSEEFIPVYAAEHGGFWKQEGVNVNVVSFPGGAPHMQAVATGEVQMGSASPVGQLIATSHGTAMTAVAVNLPQADMTVIVQNSSKYTDPSQLKGATIGVTSLGSYTDLMAHVLANHYNFTLGTDIHEAALGGLQAQLAALTTSKTQAFIWTYDEAYVLQSKGDAKILFFMSSILPVWPAECYYATNSLISSNPTLVHKVLQGLTNAVAYMKSNKTYAIQVTTQYLGVSSTVAGQIVDKAFFGNSSFSSDGQFTPQIVDALNVLRTTMLNLNVSSNLIPISQYYTSQFVPLTAQSVSPQASIIGGLSIGASPESRIESTLLVPLRNWS